MIRPKISIISVVYNLIENNRKDSFSQMLRSVKFQKYGNIEHIIIDGNSNDGTIDFLKELGCNIISEKDNGIYDAMNKGIKKASGKYITFLNSDDCYCNDNVIKNCMEALQKNNTDFLFSKTKYIDKDGNIISGIFQENPDVSNLFLTMPFSHQSMIVKTDIMKKFLFDTKYKIVADYDFTLKLFLNKYSYTYLPEYCINFMIGGVSSNIKNVHIETVMLYYNLFKNIGIYIPYNDIITMEYTKNISNHLIKKLEKIIGFKLNKKLQTKSVKSKEFHILCIPLFKISYGINFIKFYLFNIFNLLTIRWKIC